MTLLLLLACPGAPSISDPPALHPLPVNRACVVRADESPEDAVADVFVEAVGTVSEVGEGTPPSGCRDRQEWTGHAVVTWDDENTASSWISVLDGDGVTWVLSATNPWIPNPSELLGEEVAFSYRSVFGEPFAGVDAETELVLDAPGYDFWLGNAGTFEALTPSPAVALAAGDEEIQVETDCGVYARHALVGTWDGETAAVATDETYGFGSLALWNGGVTTDVELSCSETTYRGVSAFIWAME